MEWYKGCYPTMEEFKTMRNRWLMITKYFAGTKEEFEVFELGGEFLKIAAMKYEY